MCKRHSAIEAIIGHLKSEHRLGSNDLKGSVGDTHNVLLAGMGFNLMLLLRELAGNFLPYCVGLFGGQTFVANYA